VACHRQQTSISQACSTAKFDWKGEPWPHFSARADAPQGVVLRTRCSWWCSSTEPDPHEQGRDDPIPDHTHTRLCASGRGFRGSLGSGGDRGVGMFGAVGRSCWPIRRRPRAARTPKHPVAVTWPAHLPDRFADQREDDRSREVAARGRKETPRRSRGWLPRPVTARSPARIHGRGTRVVGHSVWSRASRRRPLGTQGVALW